MLYYEDSKLERFVTLNVHSIDVALKTAAVLKAWLTHAQIIMLRRLS